MKIIVGISNYNDGRFLEKLLPQVIRQGFSDIYVLDDCSSDDSGEIVSKFAEVKFVAGDSNIGIAGNRNRIMEYVGDSDVILFLDADIELRADDVMRKIEKYFGGDENLAILGALTLSETDEPMWNNCGYDLGLYSKGFEGALNEIALKHWHDDSVMKTVRELAMGRVGHFEPVRTREVDVINGAFFAIRSDVFREMGGFDSSFKRYHEETDLCVRVKENGRKVVFTDEIIVKHLGKRDDSDREEREEQMRRSTNYYLKKHYQLNDEQIEKLLR